MYGGSSSFHAPRQLASRSRHGASSDVRHYVQGCKQSDHIVLFVIIHSALECSFLWPETPSSVCGHLSPKEISRQDLLEHDRRHPDDPSTGPQRRMPPGFGKMNGSRPIDRMYQDNDFRETWSWS